MTDHEKILIVDDYPDILEGLSYVLKGHYEVTTAGNLTEAKKEVSTTVFDVICSDYAMPDGTGLELLEFCRQKKFAKSPPIRGCAVLRVYERRHQKKSPAFAAAKGGENMNEPNRTQWQIRCAFNGFCKQALKREAMNAQRDTKRQQSREVTFSDLSPLEEAMFA